MGIADKFSKGFYKISSKALSNIQEEITDNVINNLSKVSVARFTTPKNKSQVAEFEKVSFKEFKESTPKNLFTDEEELKKIYDEIKLPSRATDGSAGYDFYNPYNDITFKRFMRKPILIPTGIRATIDNGWMLMLCPRSGMGFKTGIRLMNTVGIIDSDYYFADNEGHIMIKLMKSKFTNNYTIKKGAAFVQGIFIPYGLTKNDSNTNKTKRTGGLGSTDANKQ